MKNAKWRLMAVLMSVMLLLAAGSLAMAKKIEMIGWQYQPSKSMEPSPADLIPHNHLRLLADKYEAAHPDVKIELIDIPEGLEGGGGYWTWLTTQLLGLRAPDIVFRHVNLKDIGLGKGWFVKYDQYLKEPNPYVAGNKQWADLFREGFLSGLTSVDGSIYAIPVDSLVRGLFYNKDIFNAAGVEVPKGKWTLEDFFQITSKIKEAGYISFLGRYGFTAFVLLFESVYWNDKLPEEMDVIKKDGAIDTQELVRAIKKGIYSVYDPREKAVWLTLKKISEGFPENWLSADSRRLFLTGKVALTEEASFFMPQVLADPERTFEWGILAYPHVTKESSPYGGVYIATMAETGTSYAITNTAVKNESVEEAVDWMKYLTTPENNAYMVNELYSMLPSIKGAEPLDVFKPMIELIKLSEPHYWFNPVSLLGRGYQRTYIGMMQMYFGGKLTLEQTLAQLDKAMKETADELIEEYGWEF